MQTMEDLKSKLTVYQMKIHNSFSSLQEEIDNFYPESNEEYLQVVSDLIHIFNSIELVRAKLNQKEV